MIRRLPEISDITSYKPKTAETIDSDVDAPPNARAGGESPFTGDGGQAGPGMPAEQKPEGQ